MTPAHIIQAAFAIPVGYCLARIAIAELRGEGILRFHDGEEE